MTREEAYDIIEAFERNQMPTDEDEFMFTEAMEFLINEDSNPKDMMYLGGWYYEQKKFDLALKYYEMAAAYDYTGAYECLGYIWYYGRTGTVDYKKAFLNYSKAYERGSDVCAYKLADMYKNGYFVEKDFEKYKEIVESLYRKYKGREYSFSPYAPIPEIYMRLAKIKSDAKDIKAALNLYDTAEEFLAERIQKNPFFGNLNMMKWLKGDVYELRTMDEDNLGLYDLYVLFRKPVKVKIRIRGKNYEAEVSGEGEDRAINFNGKWFRTIDDFFKKASVDDMLLTELYDEVDRIQVVR